MAHLEHLGGGSQAEVAAAGVDASARAKVVAHGPAGARRFSPFVPWLVIAAALAAWEWGVYSGRITALFFPAPSTIVSTLERLFVHGPLLADTGYTLYRMGIGLALGGTAGIVLGMLMGWSTAVRNIAEPFIAGLHPIPRTALFPLLLVLMGLGDAPRLVLVGLAAFFPLLINTMAGVRAIDPTYLEAAANYGARGLHLFRRIILPASLPGILSGARLAVNAALTLAITTELLTARNGLGGRIWMAWETLRTENLYAVLVVIVVIGLSSNRLLVMAARRLMPWSPVSGTLDK